MTPEPTCARSACKAPLRQRHFRIENNHGQCPKYRDYCMKCGRRITDGCDPNDPRMRFEIIELNEVRDGR